MLIEAMGISVMKISIITLHTVRNYGSVLQAYATQKLFEKLGHQVEFVDYWRNSDAHLLKTCLGASQRWNRNLWTRTVYTLAKLPDLLLLNRVFQRFLVSLPLTQERYYRFQELAARPPIADLYCTGSDQVWNSDYNEGIDRSYYLDYAPAGKKRIAFSASIGKKVLNHREEEEVRLLLKKYDGISVREDSAVAILQELGIQEAQLLLDPTLLLTADDWKQRMASRRIRQKYLLIYHLNRDKGFEAFAMGLAEKMNLKPVRIGYSYQNVLLPGRLILCPPVETFLSLLYYADYIVTDSFHGTAFSINFNKRFSVLYPPQFSVRLQSLLTTTGLESRAISHRDLPAADCVIDYGPVNLILEKERKKASLFLKDCLN